MARYAILNKAGNKVVNIVQAPAEIDMVAREGWVLCTDNTHIDDDYNGATFTHPTPNAVKGKREVKRTVRELLRRTDWTQVPDNLGAAKQTAWKNWRTSIRALIAQADIDPFTIVYPDPPGDLDEDGL